MTKLLVPWKYAGSKAKQLKQIKDLIPHGSRICEPFMGTGIVSGTIGKNCYGNDLNKDITTAFYYMKERNQEFLDTIFQCCIQENTTHDRFYEIRKEFNILLNADDWSPKRSGLFFTLQNMAHFGLYRIGKSGYTSTWHYLTPNLNTRKRLHDFSIIADRFLEVENKTWFNYMSEFDFSKVDVVFVDPPYVSIQGNQVFDYTVGDHMSLDDFRTLDAMCKLIAVKYDVKVVSCNYAFEGYQDTYKNAKELITKNFHRNLRKDQVQAKLSKAELYAIY